MRHQERARARKLLATISEATEQLRALLTEPTDSEVLGFDAVDGSRRRRPEWRRRGRVFHAIYQAGGRVDMLAFIQILLRSGYKDMRGANGFFRGDPLPVLKRDADEIVLTERGEEAAKFYERYWLPQEKGHA
jgi:hypothetical protein